MEVYTQEARIILAIEAIRTSKKLSIRKAAKIYNISHSTLSHRIAGRTSVYDYRLIATKLSELEEEVLVQYIIELDNRGFGPRLAGVEDIANYMLKSREGKRVRKLWAHRFVRRRQELKTRFNRVYDFQRALCEDPKLIRDWFRLFQNI
jgi:transcriptional regulator with XRE-family HTH domain